MSKDMQKFFSRSSSSQERAQGQRRDNPKRFPVRPLLTAVAAVGGCFVFIRMLFIPHQPILPLYAIESVDPYSGVAKVGPSDVGLVFVIAVVMSATLIILGTALSKSIRVQLISPGWSMAGRICAAIGWASLFITIFLVF